MSQKKAQLLNPLSGNINVTGVITASSFRGDASQATFSDGITISGVSTVGVVTGGTSVSASYYYGDGSNLTGIAADKIFEGNTEVETVDTGSDGHIKFTTEGTERARIDNVGTVRFGADADDVVFFGTTKILRMGGTSGFQIQEAGSSASITQGTGELNFYYDSGNQYKWAVFNNAGSVDLYHANNKKFETSNTGVTITGNILPEANGTRDLGATGTRWANIYTSDLDLSNEARGGNDVDGTWGSYTIQEGENDLFLINRRTGKTYKFVLEEIN